jgi:UDP-3-O-[3-hydroxymyristoyl] N-acetylglucosamine deacetylase
LSLLTPSETCHPAFVAQGERTLKKEFSFSGLGLFTGQETSVTIAPANAGQGIVFQRVDLPHKPLIPAHVNTVQGTSRCTVLGGKEASVSTVEHLLSALKAFNIDNALIKISGPEIPIFDGSALPFCELIEKVGFVENRGPKNYLMLDAPVFWSEGDVHLVALPAQEYRISYTLHYPHSEFLRAQFYSTVVNEEIIKKEIAPCRTFCLYEEVAVMIEKGLLKGGGLDNGVIIKDNKVMNPEGLRFPNEMARHKVLDLIGDLSLIPSFLAHIIAIRSGHASNVSFARQLLKSLNKVSNHITENK